MNNSISRKLEMRRTHGRMKTANTEEPFGSGRKEKLLLTVKIIFYRFRPMTAAGDFISCRQRSSVVVGQQGMNRHVDLFTTAQRRQFHHDRSTDHIRAGLAQQGDGGGERTTCR